MGIADIKEKRVIVEITSVEGYLPPDELIERELEKAFATAGRVEVSVRTQSEWKDLGIPGQSDDVDTGDLSPSEEN